MSRKFDKFITPFHDRENLYFLTKLWLEFVQKTLHQNLISSVQCPFHFLNFGVGFLGLFYISSNFLQVSIEMIWSPLLIKQKYFAVKQNSIAVNKKKKPNPFLSFMYKNQKIKID